MAHRARDQRNLWANRGCINAGAHSPAPAAAPGEWSRRHARSARAKALMRAEEVFITSTAGGVMPVSRIDDTPVGTGRPGPVTDRIRERYWAWHKDERFVEPVDYGR